MPKLVVIYYGRFQPPHAGHVAVYQHLAKAFGAKNVYVGTSNTTDPDKSPLSFEQKKKLWVKHGVPVGNIIQTKRNYNAEEVKQQLRFKNFEDFTFVVAVGQKDASRLTGGKYFDQLKSKGDTSKLKTADEKGYYYIIPNITLGGTVLSATDIRALLRKPQISKTDMSKLTAMTALKPRDIEQMKKLFEFAARKTKWKMLFERWRELSNYEK